MSDLISRQDAIDGFYNVKVHAEDCTEYDIGYNDGIDYAISKLSVMPSAEAVQGWITDRNPTENGTYMVTIADEYDDGFVCELHYGEPLMPICNVNGTCWYDADAEFGDCPYDDIIAWMPLPEPYREEAEE